MQHIQSFQNFNLIKENKKYDHIDFKPPKSVAEAAEKGLEYRKKASPSNKGGLTRKEASKQGIGSGVQRATNLKNRNNISPKVINQMVSFFARHEKNKKIEDKHKNEPWNDKGYVSWLLWGGDPGKKWAEKIKRQMEKSDEKVNESLESLPSDSQLKEWALDNVVFTDDDPETEIKIFASKHELTLPELKNLTERYLEDTGYDGEIKTNEQNALVQLINNIENILK
ncbi:MAG: hypothetical protein ACOC3V_04370 [bacterium]